MNHLIQPVCINVRLTRDGDPILTSSPTLKRIFLFSFVSQETGQKGRVGSTDKISAFSPSPHPPHFWQKSNSLLFFPFFCEQGQNRVSIDMGRKFDWLVESSLKKREPTQRVMDRAELFPSPIGSHWQVGFEREFGRGLSTSLLAEEQIRLIFFQFSISIPPLLPTLSGALIELASTEYNVTLATRGLSTNPEKFAEKGNHAKQPFPGSSFL
jgi:hypothetical protein